VRWRQLERKKKAQPVKTARILCKGASETADARNGRNNALRTLASRYQGRNRKIAENRLLPVRRLARAPPALLRLGAEALLGSLAYGVMTNL